MSNLAALLRGGTRLVLIRDYLPRQFESSGYLRIRLDFR